MAAEINKCLRLLIIIMHVYLMNQSAGLVIIASYQITYVTAQILSFFLAIFIPSSYGLSVELTMGLIVRAAPAVLAIGIVLSIVYLVGLIIACKGSRKTLRIYAILLGVLLAAQVVATAYVLGHPTLISQSAVSYMEERLRLYNKNDGEESKAAVRIWDQVMMSSEDYCCGLKGYADFRDMANLPVACCSEKDKSPAMLCNAAIAQAMSPPVVGCEAKIVNYINVSKPSFAAFPIMLIIPQVFLFAFVISAIRF